MNKRIPNRIKLEHMDRLAAYRDDVLRKTPKLHHLFLEITTDCNERCKHCGSRCGEPKAKLNSGEVQVLNSAGACETDRPLTTDEYKRILDQIKEDFDISKLNLCITGGEPLLNPDFFEIMSYAHKTGFTWGMTTNGTLIDEECVRKLKECGMCTVSVSLDGLEKTHDEFRRHPGAYKKTIEAIRLLQESGAFKHVQVTTVVHHDNIDELDEMYGIVSGLGVRSWRVINVDPIGRAHDANGLLLTDRQIRRMINFIATHRRKDDSAPGTMDVTYGCSHYLGTKLEREVREWYFLCNAGIYSASIDNTGNIIACLDIPRLPELIQGNIRRDRFKDVWENKYEIFRSDFRKTGKCTDCKHYRHCAGDSFHTWDFEANEPGLCMKGILFK